MKNKIIILAIVLLSSACNVSVTEPTTTSTATVQPVSKVQTVFDNFPDDSESTEEASLEEKYNVRDYIDNNVIKDISLPSLTDFKVRFTSDGGAVFFTKAVSDEIIWSKTPKKLVFDFFKVNNAILENNEIKYYSRYSQIVENQINIGTDIVKNINLVQSMGLSLLTQNNNYQIKGTTPVVIRQIDKNNLPYQIKNISLKVENNSYLDATEKTIIPWPGIAVNTTKINKINISVEIEAKEDVKDLEVVVGLQKLQQQLVKKDNTFSAELNLSDLTKGKNGMIIQVIDKKSLEKDTVYQGYSWIIPFISE